MHKTWTIFLGLFLVVTFLFSFSACKTIVYTHPEKSESEYAADRKLCEKAHAARPTKGPSGWREEEKQAYMKHCLESKGWRFHRE